MPGQFFPQLPQLPADGPVVNGGPDARHNPAEQRRIHFKTQAHAFPSQLREFRFQAGAQRRSQRHRRGYLRSDKPQAFVELLLQRFPNIADDADAAMIDDYKNEVSNQK